MKIKAYAAAFAAVVALFAAKTASAEGLATQNLVSRGAALYNTACSAGRVLGLCTDEAAANPRSLSLRAWAGINAAKAPNNFFKLVSLFIDNLEVASVGNTRIKVSLELK